MTTRRDCGVATMTTFRGSCRAPRATVSPSRLPVAGRAL